MNKTWLKLFHKQTTNSCLLSPSMHAILFHSSCNKSINGFPQGHSVKISSKPRVFICYNCYAMLLVIVITLFNKTTREACTSNIAQNISRPYQHKLIYQSNSSISGFGLVNTHLHLLSNG